MTSYFYYIILKGSKNEYKFNKYYNKNDVYKCLDFYSKYKSIEL